MSTKPGEKIRTTENSDLYKVSVNGTVRDIILFADFDKGTQELRYTLNPTGSQINMTTTVSTIYENNEWTDLGKSLLNDDERLAILCEDRTSTSGEKTKEKYDTYQGADVTAGIRVTYKSKYGTIDAVTEDLKTTAGLDSGLHPMVVCYVKARMYDDMGDMQKAQYFRQMYEKDMKQYPLRKSGVRQLSVPKM